LFLLCFSPHPPSSTLSTPTSVDHHSVVCVSLSLGSFFVFSSCLRVRLLLDQHPRLLIVEPDLFVVPSSSTEYSSRRSPTPANTPPSLFGFCLSDPILVTMYSTQLVAMRHSHQSTQKRRQQQQYQQPHTIRNAHSYVYDGHASQSWALFGHTGEQQRFSGAYLSAEVRPTCVPGALRRGHHLPGRHTQCALLQQRQCFGSGAGGQLLGSHCGVDGAECSGCCESGPSSDGTGEGDESGADIGCVGKLDCEEPVYSVGHRQHCHRCSSSSLSCGSLRWQRSASRWCSGSPSSSTSSSSSPSPSSSQPDCAVGDRVATAADPTRG
jgi:hypothetical protein